MNFKSISLAFLILFSVISCKKNEEVKTELKAKENITKHSTTQGSATEPSKVINPNSKFAKIEFSNLEHDFGTINGEDKVETVFVFTNTGQADLVISNAKGSCGCTVPEYPKQPIAPGEKGEIKVSFSPKGKNGMQNKTVTLTTNTQTGTETMHIKANIVK